MNSALYSYAIANQHSPRDSAQTKLPSIHSLSLDIPSYQNAAGPVPAQTPMYSLPPISSTPMTLPALQVSPARSAYFPQPHRGGSVLLPSPASSVAGTNYPHTTYSHSQNHSNSGSSVVQLSPSYTSSTSSSRLLSPVNSPYSSASSIDGLNRTRSSSDPIIKDSTPTTELARPFQSVTPPLVKEEESSDEVLTESDSPPTKKNWKPRKKRQCPECKLYFSNLATHKSTHLKPTSRPHICKYCNRGFARPNDLFRHVKCHWKEIGSDQGQFKCPFKNTAVSGDDSSATDHCCHNTGIFSRCDTFKNHLKAIHFQYPNGTKKDQRMKVSGKCRMCQGEFKNVEDWITNHIERNGCPYALNVIKKE
ncbi:hypothetical protein G9P44_000590 [Scheffersomyces stipitis]|nr:hypothetical protein G9P44_000590 [Scheffersomyces stipitis]